jgi:hypothetical protein
MLGAPSAPSVAGGGDWHAIGEASTTLIRSLPELCVSRRLGLGPRLGLRLGLRLGQVDAPCSKVGERMHLQQPKLKYMHHAAMAWCTYLQQLKRS